MAIKKAWHHEALVVHDGINLLSVLHGDGVEKYLSVQVEDGMDEMYLVIPISDKELGEFNFWDDPDGLRPLYENATEFYTWAYDDFDGDASLLRQIERKDIKAEWWPGEPETP